MSRHSATLDLQIAPGYRMCIGEQDVILTCALTDSNRLPVVGIYVDKTTGKLVIEYDDKE